MNKEEFHSIGRGSLNLNGKFYYGLDYAITDFMRNMEQENYELKQALNEIRKYVRLMGKFDGEKCTRNFKMMSADFNHILQIIDKVLGDK